MSKETKQDGAYDFGNYEKDTLTRPRDEAWDNFKSWDKAEIGDLVQGYIRDAFYRPEELNDDGSVAFHAQRGITLEQTDGTLVNGCEVLAAHENNTYKVKCGLCGTIFFPKRSFIARRVIKSCGCYQRRIHNLVCVQAFHNYRGKKNRTSGIPAVNKDAQ